jgi:hypothetical protein
VQRCLESPNPSGATLGHFGVGYLAVAARTSGTLETAKMQHTRREAAMPATRGYVRVRSTTDAKSSRQARDVRAIPTWTRTAKPSWRPTCLAVRVWQRHGDEELLGNEPGGRRRVWLLASGQCSANPHHAFAFATLIAETSRGIRR